MNDTLSTLPNKDQEDNPNVMLSILDTTYYSEGFPDKDWKSIIPRTQYISEIEYNINSRNSVVFINGEDDAGKTTLVAQFCKKHVDQTISVFFNPSNNLDFQLDYFYTNIVQQINYLMKIDQPIGDGFVGSQQYRDALYQFKKFNKRSKYNINLVIDGLEAKVKEEPDFISKLFGILPFGDDKINLIITGDKVDFLTAYPKLPKDGCASISVLGFSVPEAISFLNMKDLNNTETSELYKVTKGYPGRLRTLKRLLHSGEYSLNDITGSTKYISWVELDCESTGLTTPGNNVIFSVLALSERMFSLSELTQITHLEIENLEKAITSSPVLNGADKNIGFISIAHKRYFSNLLRGKRSQVEDLLIEFYSNNDSLSSLIDLPRLYAEKKEWEEIITLVDEEYFNKILERTGSLKLVTQTLEIGVQAAEKSNRNFDLLRYSIQGSILKELDNYHFWESEIEARISIQDYAGAISLAESAAVSVDRLNLLALIARRQKEFTEKVDEELIKLIQELYSTIDLSDAGEKIYDIVTHLMYAMPNLAIEMIERSSGEVGDGNINDWVVAKLSIAAIDASRQDDGKMDSSKKMEVVQNLNNPSVKKINRAITFLVGKYSASKVLDEVQKISDSYEKLRLLRLWLNNNKGYVPGIEEVISNALTELVYSSSETSITVEVLTELSRQLPHIRDKVACRRLYERFKEIENDLSDLGLTRDKYLYKLNIFHAEFYFDVDSSVKTINKLLTEIENLGDTLIKLEAFSEAYCKLRKTDSRLFKEKISFVHHRILSLSDTLYKSTALQTKISENFLNTIGAIDPQLALKTIKGINNTERREQARSLVLSSYLENNLKFVNIDILKDIENSFELSASKENFYLEVLERYSNSKGLHYKVILQLAQYHENVVDISHINDKLRGLTYLYKIAVKNSTWKQQLGVKLENQLYQTWKSLDADWEKIDYGFQICYDVAKENLVFAKKLFDESENLKKASWTDSKLVAYTFLNSLKLIIRAYYGLLVSRTDTIEDFKILNDLISKVPSEMAKLKTWTEIGFYAIDAQRDDVFKKVANDHVVLIVHDLISKKVNIEKCIDAITLIHLFDSGIGLTYLKKLSIELKESALIGIGFYHVSKRNPFEPYDALVGACESNFSDLVKATNVLSSINEDNEVYYLLNLICGAIQTNKNISSPQITTLITELTNIAEKKFPDPKNIQHDGYKILANLCIAKISKRVVIDLQYWTKLVEQTEKIPNLSDKIFVKAMLLDEFPFEKISNYHKIKKALFDDISTSLNDLPVHYEFVQRVIDLSDIMFRVEKTQWKKTVDKAFTLSASLTDGADVYASQRKIIDSMHRLDPAYSKELIKQVDKENQQNKLNKLLVKHYETLEVTEKLRKGKSLEQKEKENLSVIVQSVFSALQGLNSDKIVPKKLSELTSYLPIGNKLPLHKVYPIFMYYFANCAKTYRTVTDKTTNNIHRDNFRECLDAANLIQIVSQRRKNKDVILRKNFIDEEFSSNSTLRPKSREMAFNFIKSWLVEQAEEFIIIADPNFNQKDLELLKLIKESGIKVRIDILGSKIEEEGNTEKLFKKYWKEISEEDAPFANVTFCSVSDEGIAPFEGRWILTKNSGLKIGTNVSLLGSRKDGDISVLKPNEAFKICEETLIELVLRRKDQFNNQRIYYNGFSF